MLHGVLLDIDGVLHVSMQPVPAAVETLLWLEQQGYHTCFVTNTTTMGRAVLAQRLQKIGLPVQEEHIMTAPVATADYIRQHLPEKRCWVLTKGDTEADFTGIELVNGLTTAAEVVVIGGAEELLTYEAMNRAFQLLMNGATLLAMHVNLYWKTKDGLQLDSGPFVRALELASGKRAIVLGKPSRDFFEQALQKLGVAAGETVMVGDDIENDIDGAQSAGIRGVLVETGKHKGNSPLMAGSRPAAVLASIADLPEYLMREGKKHTA